jgi:hypothetical protein
VKRTLPAIYQQIISSVKHRNVAEFATRACYMYVLSLYQWLYHYLFLNISRYLMRHILRKTSSAYTSHFSHFAVLISKPTNSISLHPVPQFTVVIPVLKIFSPILII